MTNNNKKIPMVQIRWQNFTPPMLRGGGWESSIDGGVTWIPADQKKVNKLMSSQLVLWN